MISLMMILPWPPFTHAVAPKSEGDALEGDNSLENCSNSGLTNNDHTNDAIEDEMTTMTFASSFQSTPLLSNNNHTNDIMASAPPPPTTTHSSTS